MSSDPSSTTSERDDASAAAASTAAATSPATALDGGAEAVRCEASSAPAHAGLLLTTVCLCQAMVVLDISVVNIALPSMAADLHFSPGSLSWVVNAYTLVFGGLLLLGGRIADVVGHRRAMLAGLVLFALASVIGGLAQDPSALILARAGQGVAGAVLAPVSLTVIMVSFPEGPPRHRAIGVWAMVAAGGSALGVLLGGLLTDVLDWRWVLFVNVPIAAVAAPLAWRYVHDTRARARQRLDVVGAILGTASITLLVDTMVSAGDHGWSATGTLVRMVVAVVLGVAFVVWEQRGTREPLVRLSILRVRTVWLASTLVVFVGAASVAGFYFASLFLQDVLGYSPLEAGAAFVPFCLGIIVGARLATLVAVRLGTRWTLTIALVLAALGMGTFATLGADSTFASGFLLPSLITSVGIGLCMVTNTGMGTSGVAHHEAGLVSGLINTSRQCGGSIGLAALTSIAVAATTSHSVPDIVHGYDLAFATTAGLLLVAAVLAAVFTPSRRARL